MKTNTPRQVTALWLIWVLTLLGFQAWSVARALPQAPDEARLWTAEYTPESALPASRSALVPLLHEQAAWDSEYYLSIARHGYEDAAIDRVDVNDRSIPLSYAFPPLYPLLMRLLAAFPMALGMGSDTATALSGVLISALGALAACLALFQMVDEHTENTDKMRVVFLFLIFPSAFFLAQIYSEGLFIGLSFSALFASKRGNWLLSGVLAGLAALTRTVGVALAIPLALAALPALKKKDWQKAAPLLAAAALPMLVFAALQLSTWGQLSAAVQGAFYNRTLFNLARMRTDWGEAIQAILYGPAASGAYHLMEISLTVLAFAASLYWLKRDASLALYSLAVLSIALSSGDLQGMYRYALAAPAVFLALGAWSKNWLFERGWTMVSMLLLGFNAWLFAVNFWAG